jgi:L-asparaginase II
MKDNQRLVEVCRGTLVESVHRGAFCIVDRHGETVASSGEVDAPLYARSAIKPLQAIALVESGAADAFGLSPRELALACASHLGETQHVEHVRAWLQRLGLDAESLECGAHFSTSLDASHELVRSGEPVSPEHNNCSGKHSGFLTIARHLAVPTAGYIERSHPVQRLVRAILEEICEVDLDPAPSGIDGCGIPVYGISLRDTARAMAKLADPSNLPAPRREAVLRITGAMTSHPFMVAGTGHFCTNAMQALGGKVVVKTGAEGFYTGALTEPGLGIALKVDDGNGRASELVMAVLLDALGILDDLTRAALATHLAPPVLNVAGRRVGEIRATGLLRDLTVG